MSRIQHQLKSIQTALQNFDTKQASFQEASDQGDQGSIESVYSNQGASEASQGSDVSRESDTNHGTEAPENRARSTGPTTTTVVHPLASTSQQSPSSTQNTQTKKPFSKLWIVLIVVVLLITFGIILYFYYKKRKQVQLVDKSTQSQHDEKQKHKIKHQSHNPITPSFSTNPFEQIDRIAAKQKVAEQIPDPVVSKATPTSSTNNDDDQDIVPF